MMERGMERRLAAVWFADIVDYTRLSAEDEEAALALVREFQAAARKAVEGRGGRIVKFLGDGALAEFSSTQAAAQAALELQAALGAPRSGGGAARVGIHLGEVSQAPDGDLYGDGVNVAARVQAEAEPGTVVVSDDVARQLRGRREIALEPLGARALKGVPDPVRLFVARLSDVPEAGAPAVGATTPVPGPAEASIAVLPFANLSADPDNEYFSDGVTEEILTTLARLEDLKVISRTSVMRYKGATRSLRDIGRELGVASILEGSVRRAGSRVRITAQLIDARTDRHLWADRYDRDLEDIFAIQTEVAERIVEALQVKLTPKERARLAAEPTSVPAYQEYLRGLWFLNRRTPDNLRRAIEHFERSVEADPAYASAHAGIASACALQLHWGQEGGGMDPGRAVTEAERARELDAGCGEACAARGMIRIYERDWVMAEDDFQCALRCNPGDATARQWYAHYLAAMGRFDEAYGQISQARELDPLSLAVITEAGNVHLLARRFDDAERLYREALDLDPSFFAPRYKLMELYQVLGRHGEALEQLERLGYAGEKQEAIRRALEAGDTGPYFAFLRSMPVERGWPLTYVAWAQLEAGDREAALATLERAVAERDWYLIRLPLAPHWDPLRGDPRFQEILRRIGLDHVAAPDPAGSGRP
jgi:TolB-like protein/class 3 adenylate cyclase/Tfp pilus assembly protein PilF